MGTVTVSAVREQLGESPDAYKLQQIERMRKMLSESCSRSFNANEVLLCMFLKNRGLLENNEYAGTGRRLGPAELAAINSTNKDLRMLSIDGEKVIDELTIDDYEEILSIHDQIKKLFIKKLISIIAKPDEYVFEDGSYIKDHFFQKA